MLPRMGKNRVVWVGLLLCGVALSGARAQSAPPVAQGTPQGSGDAEAEGLSPAQIALRDSMMKPGLAALKQGDGAAAVDALRPALVAYPNDLRVLRYSAAAAMSAGQNEAALDLFHRALAQHPHEVWPLRLSVMGLEARLNRWGDFDRDVAVLRAAKKDGTDPALEKTNGFVVDEFDTGKGKVQGVIFPLQGGRYHTLYRFLLPKQTAAAPPVQASTSVNGQPAQCQNPNFQPYIDAESDDIDQIEFKKTHPDKAAKGERSYSLDTYGSPCSQGLIKFYFDGEPAYETVRADVMRALANVPAAAKP